MNNASRTFICMGIIIFVLLMLYQLPMLSYGNISLRPVTILSSILPEAEQKEIDVLPVVKHPKPIYTQNEKGKTVVFKEKWSKGVQPIVDFSEQKAGGMDYFYSKLLNAKTAKEPARIAYFGDSYIEGDIFTADLRELFQSHYGGVGVGWVDVGSAILKSRRSIGQTSSGITEHVVVKKPFNRSLQGINERYFAVSNGAKAKTFATRFHTHSKQWLVSSLFVRTASAMNVQAVLSNGRSKTMAFGGSSSVQMQTFNDTTTSVSLTFNPSGGNSYALGMALEGKNGVILDNFSVRGSSGLTLSDIPETTLKDFAKLRPYSLIVLHFGLNVAAAGNPVSVMKGYVNKMKTVIEHFKRAYPQTSILVMSVPDRDQRRAEGIKTMKEVKTLVALQEQLAEQEHVAFYNFYEAMGGAESVNKLVEKNLANKDYTHLSFGGGKVLAQKVFPSFQEGLKNYKQRKALERQ